MWVEKYRPKELDEMVGNEEARVRFLAWLREWERGDKAAMLLGPPGTGKTTLVHLVAQECGVNLVELNASDTRTKESLGKKIGEALSTTNLFGTRTLVFLDEVDGLAGRNDRGAVEFIKDAVKNSQNPIVMAANDPDSEQVQRLSAACLVMPIKSPPPREVELFLRHVMDSEGVPTPDELLAKIVRDSRGDLRSAINSLQSSREKVTGDAKNLSLTESQSINSFFSAEDASDALSALRASPLAPEEKVRVIFRSVVKSAPPADTMRRALEALSDADVLLGRIRKGKNWRILRYLDQLLVNQLWPVVRGAGLSYAQGDLPWNMLLRIWNDSRKLSELAARYAAPAHTSSRSARVEDVPYLLYMSSQRKFKEKMMRVLELDETFDKLLSKEAKGMKG